MTAPERPPTALETARACAEAADDAGARTWALISIAEDLTVIRRDLHWQRQNARADGRRG